MPPTAWDDAPFAEQRRLSQHVVDIVTVAISHCYHRDLTGYDIGSYARGTNIGDAIDIDVLFLGIPHDAASGYHDWTDYDTYGYQAANELTDVAQVRAIDPMVAEAITITLHELARSHVASSPVFQWLHTTQGSPDVFFRIEAAHPTERLLKLNIDVTLAHGLEHFGLAHARRFARYIDHVVAIDGVDRALVLLEDIRHFKRLVHAEAAHNGVVDKRAKVPGFLVEGLFTSGHEPRTFAQVVEELHALSGSGGMESANERARRAEFIEDQTAQLVDSGMTVAQVAGFATRGGFHTLLRVAGG